MHKVYLSLFLMIALLAVTPPAQGAGNTADVSIEKIIARSSGFHSVFVERWFPPTSVTDFPDEGCTYVNRGVVDQADLGAEFMLNTIVDAKNKSRRLVLRVDGCAPVNPSESSATAPRIVKVAVK